VAVIGVSKENHGYALHSSFAVIAFIDAPFSADFAEMRARCLYEVTQIKGNGEAHPYLSPTDEFAGDEL
jgi:hypothetical protein